MKVLSLVIKNIGLIEDCTIAFDKPLILFFGDIQQGKTTILNAVRWCFGGAFPADILRHGTEEGFINLNLSDGSITRSFYTANDKTIKARAIKFVRGGVLVPQPVEEIKKFLNPFLLDQEFLKNKSELERKIFFIELFGLSTHELDTEYAKLDREASELRSKISGFGDISLVSVEPVNIDHLKHALQNARDNHAVVIQQRRDELAKRRTTYATLLETVRTANAEIQTHNAYYNNVASAKENQLKKIAQIEADLATARETLQLQERYLSENSVKDMISAPPAPETSLLEQSLSELPNTAELELKLSEAAATNVRYEQYQKDKSRLESKEAIARFLTEKENRQRQIKQERIEKLKSLSETAGIPGLSFTDDGAFSYEGTSAGMLSTSQVMKLSSSLSAKYPAGFGLELIDRGESLGKSIFDFVNKAKTEEKTILATIVGERPATVPEHVGVFVVEQGKVS